MKTISCILLQHIGSGRFALFSSNNWYFVKQIIHQSKYIYCSHNHFLDFHDCTGTLYKPFTASLINGSYNLFVFWVSLYKCEVLCLVCVPVMSVAMILVWICEVLCLVCVPVISVAMKLVLHLYKEIITC